MQQETIKIFVGCDPNDCDLEQMMVLDYSIAKHTKAPYEIVWMQLSKDPNSFWYSDLKRKKGWDTSLWVTPFSGFRWGIPAYCDYEGKAIYMDADMLVLSDIQDLWNHPFNEGSIMVAKGGEQIHRTCVALWDCAAAKKALPSIKRIKSKAKSHNRLIGMLRENPNLVTPFNDNYNCLDGEDLPVEEIKILHFTDIDTQFSHKYSIPRLESEGRKHWYEGDVNPHWRKDLADLFDQYYQEALEAGYSLDNYRNVGFGDIEKQDMSDYVGSRHLPLHAPDKSRSKFKRLLHKIKGIFK